MPSGRRKEHPDGSHLGVPAEIEGPFLEKIAAGFSLPAAAGKLGVPPRNVKRWVERGRAAEKRRHDGETLTEYDEAWADFAVRYDVALGLRAHGFEERARKLADEGMGSYMQPMRALERLHPDEWVDKSRQSDGSGPGIQIIIASALPDRALPVVEVRGLPRGGDAEDREGLPAAPAAGELSP